jgi:putative lipoprotein (rSAM/lipoprotein system)
MKVRFYRWYNAVLTALLSMLGYGCSSDEPMDMYGTPVEYGTPHADYIVKGLVTDEASTPIQGIKTSLKQTWQTDAGPYVFGIDSIQTNESGIYQLKSNGIPAGQTKLIIEDIAAGQTKLIIEDIDGDANGGLFLSDTLDIDYDKAVKTKEGDGRWYGGVYEIIQDVKLKKKQ